MNLFNIIIDLKALENKSSALDMSKYMRNKFEFFGVAAPKRAEICKPYFKEAKKSGVIDWDFINYCWEHEKRECQYIAAQYLKIMKNSLLPKDLLKLRKLIVTKSWWDTVDILDRVVGSLVYDNKKMQGIILEWSVDENIWLRRVAIDHQLLRKDKMNVELLEKILVNNLNQEEFFINKAIGWALRDYSKTNPTWVADFIKQHSPNMSKLSIREASKYFKNKDIM